MAATLDCVTAVACWLAINPALWVSVLFDACTSATLEHGEREEWLETKMRDLSVTIKCSRHYHGLVRRYVA